jgi:sugar phosphate permease
MVGFVAMRLKRPSAPTIVLGLLCLMYLITYVNRQNLATAGGDISRDLHLSRSQLGKILSTFGYTYAIFQILGGWIGDRLGARRTLFVCGLVWATATALTGLVGSLTSMYLVRLLLGVGEGATFPVATRAMQSWTPADRRGFAQGITHAFSRVGNAITPPLVASLISVIAWRGSFVVLGLGSFAWVFVWFWYFRDVPAEHGGITPADMAKLPNQGQGITRQRVQIPWKRLIRRMAPVTLVYFCYGWTLWLYLNWLPLYFVHEYNLQITRSALFAATVFFAGVGGDYLGGVITDRILHTTGDLRKARRDFVIVAFVCSFIFMLPVFATHNLTIIVCSLAAAFFCAELVIGPMWAIPMDIAPKYSGTASGLMNTGSAIAAVLSPLAFGYIVEWTDNYQLPFIGSLGLLLAGAALAFTMHPERAFDADVPTQAQSAAI